MQKVKRIQKKKKDATLRLLYVHLPCGKKGVTCETNKVNLKWFLGICNDECEAPWNWGKYRCPDGDTAGWRRRAYWLHLHISFHPSRFISIWSPRSPYFPDSPSRNGALPIFDVSRQRSGTTPFTVTRWIEIEIHFPSDTLPLSYIHLHPLLSHMHTYIVTACSQVIAKIHHHLFFIPHRYYKLYFFVHFLFITLTKKMRKCVYKFCYFLLI